MIACLIDRHCRCRRVDICQGLSDRLEQCMWDRLPVAWAGGVCVGKGKGYSNVRTRNAMPIGQRDFGKLIIIITYRQC